MLDVTAGLVKLRTEDPQVLCAHFEISPHIASFLTARATTTTVLNSLINHGHWFDAATLLAHGLPKLEAVWWACRVSRDHLGTERESDAAKLVAIAEAWLRLPSEKEREAVRIKAFEAAMKLGSRSPAHWAAMALFWSAGNITPGSGVETPPPQFLYARGVAACVDLAAALALADREAFYRRALMRGLDIARGGSGNTPD